MEYEEKVIIVEGRSDLKKVKRIINDDVLIICTNGTMGITKVEELVDQYMLDDKDVFILVDEDDSGHKLRKQLIMELPHAVNLYVDRSYREVETTPDHVLASILASANIEIYPEFLKGRIE
ncbi:toprim domain-containing protein [Salirhabdus sp. Marseille-P4669]|uniref:toprim domain-containing protein n=1 Tax=Salirhabdus sp. Marseille-P4669 TaxID=2042310 RepID=UPI000C7CF7C4|nr:toprim domain-containing protein [Salirhabdus sp. Marseille-P4669]